MPNPHVCLCAFMDHGPVLNSVFPVALCLDLHLARHLWVICSLCILWHPQTSPRLTLCLWHWGSPSQASTWQNHSGRIRCSIQVSLSHLSFFSLNLVAWMETYIFKYPKCESLSPKSSQCGTCSSYSLQNETNPWWLQRSEITCDRCVSPLWYSKSPS